MPHMSITDPWQQLSKGWNSRGYLPHFDMAGTAQMITYRLADSLPPSRLAALRAGVSPLDKAAIVEIVHGELDAGMGDCWLSRPEVARVVEDNFLHFDGERYRLLCWVIMPNHVHLMVELLPGWPLDKLVHGWKSYTANQANRLLGLTGAFWQEDYFDRLIRSEQHFHQAAAYIHSIR